jgi:hypothetical protein
VADLVRPKDGAGRVVGGVDRDELGAPGDEALEVLEVEPEAAIVRAHFPERDIGAERRRHALDLLVGRVDGDDVVAGVEQGVEEQVVRLDRAGGDQDVVRAGALVGRGDVLTECLGPPRFAVAKAGREERFECRGPFTLRQQSDQLIDAHRQDAALGDVVLDPCFPERHPPFQPEILDLHGFSLAPRSTAGQRHRQQGEDAPSSPIRIGRRPSYPGLTPRGASLRCRPRPNRPTRESGGAPMAIPVQLVSAVRAEVEAEVLAAYRARTPISAALHAEASAVMPGGDTRTVAFHAPYPLAIQHGQGCVLWDADGNEYIDLLNNYTSLIHGHAHPAVTAAVSAQLPLGTAFPAPNAVQTRLATILTDRVASVDLVRFCNSGTEAVMNALRAARAFTGRDLIVKVEGGYHGTYDDVEVSVHPDPAVETAGSADAPLPVLDAIGVPANTIEAVSVIPFNDVAAAERVFRERGDDIAAVIVEPVMGAGGMIPAEESFLEALRALTIETGALLIFDEVMSFRLMPAASRSTTASGRI